MKRFRTQWLAALGAALLLALSVSSAFGAHPEGDGENRGQQVSAFVHALISGTDEDPEQEEEETEGDEEEVEGEEGEEEEVAGDEEDSDSNHGQCVREVAWSLDVGGLNENHGGAVSHAARVTCWETGDEEAPEESAEEAPEVESDTEEGSGEVVDGPGNSAAAHDRAPGKNKPEGVRGNGNGHAKGHGKH